MKYNNEIEKAIKFLVFSIKKSGRNPKPVITQYTVADALAEKISVEYSKYCLEIFGAVLHHNVDKVSVMGGLVNIDWGNAEMLKPIRVLVKGGN